jgi:hypothetical protein
MSDYDLFGADNGDQDPVTLPLTAAVRQRKTGLEVGDGSVLKRARAAASSVPASSADQPRQPSLPQAQRASQGAGPQSQADGVGAYGGRSPTLGGLQAGYDTQIANYNKQLQGLSEDPDYTALGEQQRARGQEGVQMLGASIAAGMGPQDMRGLQGQLAQESARMMAPQKIEGGEVDVSGRVRLDPGYKRQKQIESLREAINNLEKQKLAAVTSEEKFRIEERQNQMMHEVRSMMAGTAEQARLDRAEHARDMAAIARDKLEAKNGPLGVKDAAQIEDRMGDDFRKETDSLRGAVTATRRVASLPEGKLNSVEQQTLAVLLQKFLDPPSVVREGEFDRAAKAGGFYERVKLALPALLHGDSLPPIVIKEIREMAKLYEKDSIEQIHNISRSYLERSQRRGLDARNVVGVWVPPEAGAPGAPVNPEQYYQHGAR